VNRRLIVIAAVGLGLLGGAGGARAAVIGTDEQSHRICIAVTNDPNSTNRDGICLQTAPGLP
jgi:hypothetical protein